MKPYYQRSNITIYHGDSRSLVKLLDFASVGAVVTDPPYGILNVESGNTMAIRKSRRAAGSGKLKNRLINTADFEWDSFPPDKPMLDALRAIGTAQIIWGGNYLPLPPTRCVLTWDKLQPWQNFSQVEIAWTSLDRPAAIFRHDKSDIPGKVHPTQKPVELMLWCLGFLDAELILDPYLGAGTTAVSCIKTGRGCVGIESEERYCEVAAKRCERELEQGVLFKPEAVPVETQAEMFQ